MMSSTTSKVAPFKAVACPRKAGRVAAPRLAAIRKEAESKDANWSAMPMVAISAVMLLNSGVANAATLGKGYGNSVGGSDQFKETVEQGIGKVQQGVQDTPFNLPDPSNVLESPASTTLSGAFDQTVSNVKNAFSEGGDNAREASEGINSKVAKGAADIAQNAPAAIKSGIDNVQRNVDDSKNTLQRSVGDKNIFQSGVEQIQDFMGNSGAEDSFKTNVDNAKQAPKNLQTSFFQANDNNPLAGAADKAKQTAGDVRDAFSTGPSGVKSALQSGKQEASKNLEKLKQTAGGAGDAFSTGTSGVKDAFQGGKQEAAKNVEGEADGR